MSKILHDDDNNNSNNDAKATATPRVFFENSRANDPEKEVLRNIVGKEEHDRSDCQHFLLFQKSFLPVKNKSSIF